jgi:hypothetical protein
VDAGVLTWGGLIAFIVLAFIVDFFFFQRDHHTRRRSSALRCGR